MKKISKRWLMTQALRAQLPALNATHETHSLDKIIQVSYVLPDSFWYWYPIEFDGKDTFFGLVVAAVVEFDTFHLGELHAVRGPWGLSVERDIGFTPTAVRNVVWRHRNCRGADVMLGFGTA